MGNSTLKVLALPAILLSVCFAFFKGNTSHGFQPEKEPTIYINPVRFTEVAPAPWNNVSSEPHKAGMMAENLKDEDGRPTEVDIYMEAPTSYPFSKTPNDQKEVDGVFPARVMWRGWGGKTPWAFRIADLRPNYDYTLTFFASQLSYEGNQIIYEINGTIVRYEGVVNNSEKVLKVTVTSDTEGSILVKVNRLDGSLSSLAALVIEDATDNVFAPQPYEAKPIVLAKSTSTPKQQSTGQTKGRAKSGGGYYSANLVNAAAAISRKRLVRPDHNPRNQVIELYGGYEVDWEDPDNRVEGTANIHDPKSAWSIDDVTWKDGKLAGVNGPEYYFKQKFQYVKQPWKDLSAYYYMNRETRLDTIVFYQRDNRPINPEGTCNFWYSLWGSKDNFSWTKILDSLSFDRSNRWKGYVTRDPNYYCYLRLKVESSDPNMYHDCKTNSSLIKMLASGEYRGGYITTFMKPEDLPTAADKENTFNSFFGTNCFTSDPDTLRAKFGFLRYYMSYGDFSNELGGKFFINQNVQGQYNTHYKYIKHAGKDGKAVRWLKNNIIYRNKQVKEINPDTKILYCIQQGANWHVNLKAPKEGGWYYFRDENHNKKLDYPEELLPYSTTMHLLRGEASVQPGYTQNPSDVREIKEEYRVHPEGYEKAGEVIDYWTEDGVLAPWIAGYFDTSKPDQPNTQKYNQGMRVPWQKHKAMADPTKRDSVLSDPLTYAYDATFFYNLTAVHGPNEVDMKTLWVQPGQVDRTGHGVMDMLEWENESDKTWRGPLAHMWPQWAAAYMSAIMDGHMGKIKGPHNNSITGYMCAAPMLDFLYQGTTHSSCHDIKLALDALTALRTKRKAELNAQGITRHPGNGMPLYILPPNFWANWHHYSGTNKHEHDRNYTKYAKAQDEKGLTATDDNMYEETRKQTAWLKSFYPNVKTVMTEWGTGTFSGGKYSPLKQDYGVEDDRMEAKQDSIISHLEGEKAKLKATAIPDQGAISKIDRSLERAKRMEMIAMPEEGGMFYQQASWLIRGSLELWFSGLDKLSQYWLCDRSGYYDFFKYNEELDRMMPDHEKKWLMEPRNNYATFRGFGLYGHPRHGHGGYPIKTSGYAFHNLKKILGENVAVKREYLNEGEKIKSFLTYNKEKDYYAMVVFKATAQNLKTKDFEIRLPDGASQVEVVNFILDNYSPEVQKVNGAVVNRTITEKPVIIRFKLPERSLKSKS